MVSPYSKYTEKTTMWVDNFYIVFLIKNLSMHCKKIIQCNGKMNPIKMLTRHFSIDIVVYCW